MNNLLTERLKEIAGQNLLTGDDKEKARLIKCCNYLATQFEIAAKQGGYENNVLQLAAGMLAKDK